MPDALPPGLDAELAWEQAHRPAPEPLPSRRRRAGHAGQLLVAALADLGTLLLAVALAWAVAALGGASLNPYQIGLAAVLGALVLAPVALACLWVWRGTPGMLLSSFGAARAIPFARALLVAAVWFAALPAMALPLAVRWGGRSVLERLLGVPLRSRSPHDSA
ncbi:MAG TPA: hypothetical protein P5234_13235 [Thermoanaerobaculaceae bacterium]|nr:hypothetical protein [Thermoanaerobaculaceae bacterium]HRS17196.1 hypothetical protein [Thermoanaerobaculaceae bacterium]